MRSGLLAAVVIVAALSTGCARVSVVTEIRSDGSFDRAVTYKAVNSTGPGSPTAPKLEEFFSIPPEGNGMTHERATTPSEVTLTATKAFGPESQLQDDVKVSVKGETAFRNYARVTALGDGRFEYVERVKWVGKKTDDPGATAKVKERVRKILPAEATDQQVDAVATGVIGGLNEAIMGPSEPMVLMLLMHPDLAERRMRAKVKHAFTDSLTAAGYQGAERDAILAKALKDFNTQDVLQPQQEAQAATTGNPDDTAVQFVPLLFVVKVPGEVLETNGIRDDESGEVWWALYSASAMYRDTVMRVVFRP
jgi:hypothetical protein